MGSFAARADIEQALRHLQPFLAKLATRVPAKNNVRGTSVNRMIGRTAVTTQRTHRILAIPVIFRLTIPLTTAGVAV
jgi:hypothetical protein